MNFWLLTWTTYGTWLPGDERGFIGRVRVADGVRESAHRWGEPVQAPNAALAAYARSRLKHAPVRLAVQQAACLGAQFQETAAHRGWRIKAFAIMTTHLHLVVGAGDETPAEDLLRDLKAYGSRALDRLANTRNRKWWTAHGSRRLLADEAGLAAAIDYVMRQSAPLLIWSRDEPRPPACGGAKQRVERIHHRGD